MKSLLWIISLFRLVSSKHQIYITEDSNCATAENAPQKPCYSLHELINDQILLSIGSPVTLLLLPGLHIIPENHTLLASNMSELDMYPLDDEVVRIECQPQAGIVIQGVDKLNIRSLNFTFCTLQYTQTDKTDGFQDIVNVCHFEKCGFQSNDQNYAVIVDYPTLSITCHFLSCQFLSNSGAIKSENPTESEDINVNIFIVNTTFANNGQRENDGGALAISNVNLTVLRSLFLNNTASTGGAIAAVYSSLLLQDVSFHGNHGGDGGSIYFSHFILQIVGCHFVNNLGLWRCYTSVEV